MYIPHIKFQDPVSVLNRMQALLTDRHILQVLGIKVRNDIPMITLHPSKQFLTVCFILYAGYVYILIWKHNILKHWLPDGKFWYNCPHGLLVQILTFKRLCSFYVFKPALFKNRVVNVDRKDNYCNVPKFSDRHWQVGVTGLCKQCRPRSDFSRSRDLLQEASLIRVYTVSLFWHITGYQLFRNSPLFTLYR